MARGGHWPGSIDPFTHNRFVTAGILSVMREYKVIDAWAQPDEVAAHVEAFPGRFSDSVVQGLRLPEGEITQRLRTELAIARYAQGVLFIGQGGRTCRVEPDAIRGSGWPAGNPAAPRG
jgi:hypothetical protein